MAWSLCDVQFGCRVAERFKVWLVFSRLCSRCTRHCTTHHMHMHTRTRMHAPTPAHSSAHICNCCACSAARTFSLVYQSSGPMLAVKGKGTCHRTCTYTHTCTRTCTHAQPQGFSFVYPTSRPTHAVEVHAEDLARLEPEEFLNDTCIDFYLKWIEEHCEPAMRQRCHFFSSFFFKVGDSTNRSSSRRSSSSNSRSFFFKVCDRSSSSGRSCSSSSRSSRSTVRRTSPRWMRTSALGDLIEHNTLGDLIEHNTSCFHTVFTPPFPDPIHYELGQKIIGAEGGDAGSSSNALCTSPWILPSLPLTYTQRAHGQTLLVEADGEPWWWQWQRQRAGY